jgi:predicted peptidase
MIRPLKLCLLLLLVVAGLLGAGCNGARDTAVDLLGKHDRTGFLLKEITRGARTRRYVIFVPLTYSFTSPAKTPVIVFLHAASQGGNLGKDQLRVGLGPVVADLESSFNFFVLFPQSQNGYWDPTSESGMDVLFELEDLAKTYPGADMERVTLTGIGSGGAGTWAMGAKYKNRFAALVPMASTGSNQNDARTLSDIPIRAYHNSGDLLAATFWDTVMVERIRSFGGKAEMFLNDGFSSNCWEYAYGQTDLFQWIAQQRRPRPYGMTPTPTPVPAGSSLRANSAAYVSVIP